MRTPNANTAPCQLSTISPFLSAKYQAPISDAQNRLEEAFRRFPAFTEHQTGKYSSTDEEKGIPPPPLRPPIPISWVRQRRGLRKRINNQLDLCIIFAKSCYSANTNLLISEVFSKQHHQTPTFQTSICGIETFPIQS